MVRSKSLQPTDYGRGHGVEGRYSAAAGDGHDVLRVAQALVVEVPERAGDVHAVAGFPVVEDVCGGVGGVRALYRERVARVLRPEGVRRVGADGCTACAPARRLWSSLTDTYWLARKKAISCVPFSPVRHEHEALRVPVVGYGVDAAVLHRRVQGASPGRWR